MKEYRGFLIVYSWREDTYSVVGFSYGDVFISEEEAKDEIDFELGFWEQK